MPLRLLPATSTTDARLLLTARTLRGFADGFVSVLLASYLSAIGFSAFEIGIIVTATLLGSALLTLAVGLVGHDWQHRRILLAASFLMFLTGIGFAGINDFWPLVVVAVLGTLNPTANDVSVFLPAEQAALAETVEARDRTAIFARHNLMGLFAAALGALASGLPIIVADWQDWDPTEVQRTGFLLYAAIAVAIAAVYRRLTPRIEPVSDKATTGILAESKGIVLRLAALFSLDSFGGGFAIDALVALWLFERFDYSVETVGVVFFAASLLASLSQLGSSWLAARIGLINTMVFTHLPANIFLVMAALMPTGELAILFLLLRMLLSRMDVPARVSYVMAVVPPAERTAAATVTNLPRSLAQAISPLVAGALLSLSTFGWPLILAGLTKALYDVLLYFQFRSIRPPEEKVEPALAV
jgi:MFS family permease